MVPLYKIKGESHKRALPNRPECLCWTPSEDNGLRSFVATGTVLFPGKTMGDMDFDDYSFFNNMSDDQLVQLAIERSLADANMSPWQRRQRMIHPATATQPCPPKPVPVTAHPPTAAPANPPGNIPSETGNDRLNREPQSHIFSGDNERLMAWRKENGHMRVAVQPLTSLDPLLRALWHGDAEALKEIIEENPAALDEPNKDGWILLHDAAHYGYVECLEVLLRAKPDTINKRTDKNQTPLMLAAARKHVACVRHLLLEGADPNIGNNQGETPLYKACEKPNEEIVELLLSYGAKPSRYCQQRGTPLHEAVRNKNSTIVTLLLRAGANLTAKNIYGIDPVFTAAQVGAIQVLKLLIDSGGDINTEANDGATAIYEAAKNGHDEVVEYLLSNRGNVNKPKKSGLLPLHIAARNGHYGIVCKLGLRTNRQKIRASGISPLHYAAEHNRDEILEVLIKFDYDVNASLSDDWSKMYEDHRRTALYSAVANGNIEAASMLLEAGANPNLDTFNPLLVAVRKGCIEMVTLLVENGANMNALLPTHPTTFPGPVMFSMNCLPMLKYLMDNGCSAKSCFNCTYGSNPHPPVKLRPSRRADLCCNDEPPSEPLQFCEMISSILHRKQTGSIIDLLLDYVGHVKLCARLTELLDSCNGWAHIKEKAKPPHPLMQLCRLKIRQLIGIQKIRLIHTLPLPGRLIKFLSHEKEETHFGDIL